MKTILLALSCSVLLGGLSAASAKADVFTFSIPGTVDPASGTINATPIAGSPGQFNATSIFGTITVGTTVETITAFLPANTYPTYGPGNNILYYPGTIPANDSMLYPAQSVPSFLDIYGLSFVAGGQDYNLYYGNVDDIANVYNLDYGVSSNDKLAGFNLVDTSLPAATPEPSSLLLLGTGVLGTAGMLRRRFQS